MGHEAVGRIVRLGPGRVHDVADEKLQIGDRIMWAHSECNDCLYLQCTTRAGDVSTAGPVTACPPWINLWAASPNTGTFFRLQSR
jgi:D-arabinose 1-dehydrogenase-like Zn-dependent alcohol dehydrogenase